MSFYDNLSKDDKKKLGKTFTNFRFDNPYHEYDDEARYKNYRGRIVMEKGILDGETYYELLEKDRQDPNKYVLGELTSRVGELKRDKNKHIITKTVTAEVFDQMTPVSTEVLKGEVSLSSPTEGGKKRKSRKLKKKSKRKSRKARKSHKKRR